MTKRETATVTCPKCGKDSNFAVYLSINRQVSPDLAEKLMDGSLFRFDCPECGCSTIVTHQCLYNDMEAGYMVQLVPGDEDKEFIDEFEKLASDELMAFAAGHYETRIVHTLNELREKAMVIRDGYDDGTIELLKVFVMFSAIEQGDADRDSDILYESTEDGELVFAVFRGDDISAVAAPADMLEMIAKEFGENPGRGAGYYVDAEWAADVISRKPE